MITKPAGVFHILQKDKNHHSAHRQAAGHQRAQNKRAAP